MIKLQSFNSMLGSLGTDKMDKSVYGVCVCVCVFNSDSWFVVSTPGDCVSLTYWIKKLYMYPVLTIFVYLRVFCGVVKQKSRRELTSCGI